MTIELLKAIPILVSLDLEATATFYREKLGFEIVTQFDDYLIVRRTPFEIHFWNSGDQYSAENTACYMHVDNIGRLYQEYQDAGVIAPDGQLEKLPHGMVQFAIHDGDGNQITFGEPV